MKTNLVADNRHFRTGSIQKICKQRCTAERLEGLHKVIGTNPKYEAIAHEYKNLFQKLMSELTNEQRKDLLKLDELAALQEEFSNEFIVFEMMR